ncbi:MAG: hypothetical protein WC863_01520 [Patescibacteria group bacterium]
MVYSNFYDRFYRARRASAKAFLALWYFLPSRFYFLASGLLNILAWAEAAFIRHSLSGDLLVLHYNVDSGIDLVGDPAQIFWYPIFGLVILIINYSLAAAYSKQPNFRFGAHLLLATALIFSGLLNFVLMFVYLVNFK